VEGDVDGILLVEGNDLVLLGPVLSDLDLPPQVVLLVVDIDDDFLVRVDIDNFAIGGRERRGGEGGEVVMGDGRRLGRVNAIAGTVVGVFFRRRVGWLMRTDGGLLDFTLIDVLAVVVGM
jgi:hypothetical protein